MKLLRKEALLDLVPWIIGIGTISLLLFFLTRTSEFVDTLRTIFSTFVGATAAFSLERWNKRRVENENNIVASNKAIFVIGQIYIFYATYKKQIVTPACKTPYPWLAMQPAIIGPKEKISFDMNSLYFLLQTKDPNILGLLYTEEQRFYTILESIRKRDDILEKRLRPKLEEIGIMEGTLIASEMYRKIEQNLGPDLRIMCKRLFEEIVVSLDQNIDSLVETQKKLIDLLQDKFKKSKLLIEAKFTVPKEG